MFYNKNKRDISLTLKPVMIGNSLGFILPKKNYILNREHEYNIKIEITDLTLETLEEE